FEAIVQFQRFLHERFPFLVIKLPYEEFAQKVEAPCEFLRVLRGSLTIRRELPLNRDAMLQKRLRFLHLISVHQRNAKFNAGCGSVSTVWPVKGGANLQCFTQCSLTLSITTQANISHTNCEECLRPKRRLVWEFA